MAAMPAPDQLALAALLTEARNPATMHLDELSTLDMLTLINAEDATVAAAVHAELPSIARAVDAIAARFQQGGRLFYIGAGTSGRLGVLDASECPPTFSVPATLVQGLIAGGDRALRKIPPKKEQPTSSPRASPTPLLICHLDQSPLLLRTERRDLHPRPRLTPLSPIPYPLMFSSASPPPAARPTFSAPSRTQSPSAHSPLASVASPAHFFRSKPSSPSPPRPAPKSSPARPA
jgi:hypothetical protein